MEGCAGSTAADPSPSLYPHELQLLQELEDFCSSSEFTSAIQEFVELHADGFERTDEYSLEYYEKYKAYCDMIERLIEEFLARQGNDPTTLFDICRKLQVVDPGSITCVDYLLASTEFENFIELMFDFKSMREWEYDEDEALEWSCPPDSDEVFSETGASGDTGGNASS